MQTGYFDKKTEAQLKNTLQDQLKKIRERIIQPQQHGSAKRKEIGELSCHAPDEHRKKSKVWYEENKDRPTPAAAAEPPARSELHPPKERAIRKVTCQVCRWGSSDPFLEPSR